MLLHRPFLRSGVRRKLVCGLADALIVCSIESSWGVYQSHYFTSKVLGHVSSSDLAWVGSIQATGQPLVGVYVAQWLPDLISDVAADWLVFSRSESALGSLASWEHA